VVAPVAAAAAAVERGEGRLVWRQGFYLENIWRRGSYKVMDIFIYIYMYL